MPTTLILPPPPILGRRHLCWNVYCTRAIITRGLYIFTPFFIAVYIVERLVTVTDINKEILRFLGLKSAVSN